MTQYVDLKSIESHLLGHGVEFAGIINKQGRIIDNVCKKEINLSKEQRETFFMTNSLNLSMQKDYDDELGAVQYTVTERKNSKVVSIPIPLVSIVLVMDKQARPSLLVKKTLKAIDYVRRLDGKMPGLEITV